MLILIEINKSENTTSSINQEVQVLTKLLTINNLRNFNKIYNIILYIPYMYTYNIYNVHVLYATILYYEYYNYIILLHQYIIPLYGACQMAQWVKNPTAMQEMQATRVQFLGWENPLEEGMATTPVFLPGESHGQEEPGRLQFIGWQRVRHN